MKLLREAAQEVRYLKEPLKEEVEGETVPSAPQYYIEGIYIQADLQNRNGRVYPSEVVDKAVEQYINDFIVPKRSFGELGHPNTPSLNLHLASHLIVDLTKDGSNWIGKSKILSTPNGNIVKSLMDEGCTLGVSSRGLGSVQDVKGVKVVQDDFFFVTAADIVSDPSAPDAFVSNIVEGLEWVMAADGNWIQRELPKLKKKADKIVRENKNLKEEQEKLFMGLFEDFLRKL